MCCILSLIYSWLNVPLAHARKSVLRLAKGMCSVHGAVHRATAQTGQPQVNPVPVVERAQVHV